MIRLCYFGRIAPEKGIDVLIRAVEMVKIPVELDVYGIGAEGDSGERIGDRGSNKVRWLEPVKPEAVVETIRKYDALVVPSVWLETGPLVVLEAFAAGVPVIGSRLGGIAEMVRDGVDGLLFEAGNPEDLALSLERLTTELINLKQNVKKPNNLKIVASRHHSLYLDLMQKL